MSISKKIIEGNNQPSEGNAVVGGGGARALNPLEFIDPNHVLSVDASGQLITDINNSLDTRLFRGKAWSDCIPIRLQLTVCAVCAVLMAGNMWCA